jgi:hypothetical protein
LRKLELVRDPTLGEHFQVSRAKHMAGQKRVPNKQAGRNENSKRKGGVHIFSGPGDVEKAKVSVKRP